MIVNRSAPSATVVPVLVYSDVGKAIAWLCGAFGFTERLRAGGRDGVTTHAQLAIADGEIMIGRAGGQYQPPRAEGFSQYVLVHVPDADAHLHRAQQFGAQIEHAPRNMPFGERQYSAVDLEGHRWTFSQHIADVAPEEWGATQTRAR